MEDMARLRSSIQLTFEALAVRHSNSPCTETICVPPVLLSPVLLRPIRSAQSNTSPLPIHTSTMTFHGSDSENSDSALWRGSGGSVSVPRRSLASGSRSSTPVMSPIMNRSSSGSRLGALHLMSRSGSGSGLLPGRTLLQRADSINESDRRRKRLRRRTMIYEKITPKLKDAIKITPNIH
ncbi:hypothetical protein KIN20_030213 [Parelaphostrongylus tenuis]|uniref:Uncharacterized protein n=1 Tax=Parelaphostrongylus tenuis TaxID=148309 RepID=A0AAD5R4A9_PARTN|nr:hypothetical protein KIN20_030213 [Parelaphostrongylus tenuis]